MTYTRANHSQINLKINKLRSYQSNTIPNVQDSDQGQAKAQLVFIINEIENKLKNLNPGKRSKDEIRNINAYLKQLVDAINAPNTQAKKDCLEKVNDIQNWTDNVPDILFLLSGFVGNMTSFVASVLGFPLIDRSKQNLKSSTENIMSFLGEQIKQIEEIKQIKQIEEIEEIKFKYKSEKNEILEGAITLPVEVTSIDKPVLAKYRETLISVVIPEGVTIIEEYAFNVFYNLNSIDLPKSLTTISQFAFTRSAIHSLVIPNGVTSIEYAAFYCCRSLVSVVIPNSVKSIGKCAFSGCSSLTSLVISDSVTFLGDSVFSSCDKLTSITINAKTAEGYQRVLNMLPPHLQEIARKTEKKKTQLILQFSAVPSPLPTELAAKISFFAVAIDNKRDPNGKTPLFKDDKERDELETKVTRAIKNLM